MDGQNKDIPPVTPEVQLMGMLFGIPIVHMIGCATEMHVFDLLADGPTSAGRVAERAGTLVEPTYRLLRALSVLGFTHEDDQQQFSLAAMGELLRSDRPGSFAPMAIMVSRDWGSVHFSEMMYSLKTGHSAFKNHHGAALFDWLAARPEDEQLFSRSMATFSSLEIAAILQAYDFSMHRDVVDLGGAHGEFLMAILAAAPRTRGILFDFPRVVSEAQRLLRLPPELACRVAFEGGNFFDSVPAGGDLYTLKNILHDWDDERATRILRNVAAVLPKGGRVMVVEQGIAPPGVAHFGKVLDLVMLAQLDGARERTQEQLAVLMSAAGIHLEHAIPTMGPVTLFLGAKA